MADDADNVMVVEERHRADFEAFMREKRRIESMHGYDPTLPVNCIECGEDIPQERLKLLPHTRRCAACSAEIERVLLGGPVP